MPESSLPKPGGGRLAKYAAGKVAEKAAAVCDELPVKPGGGRLAKYAADRVVEEAAAARRLLDARVPGRVARAQVELQAVDLGRQPLRRRHGPEKAVPA